MCHLRGKVHCTGGEITNPGPAEGPSASVNNFFQYFENGKGAHLTCYALKYRQKMKNLLCNYFSRKRRNFVQIHGKDKISKEER